MTSRNPTYFPGDLRRALLDAAAAEVAESGAAGASLRAVARRAGVSHAAPAHHFGDRAGLFTALAIEGFERLAADVRAAGAGPDPAPLRLRRAGLAYLEFSRREPAVFDLMFRSDLLRPDDPELQRAGGEAHAALADLVTELVSDRDDVDPVSGTAAAWCLVHGLAVLWRNGPLPGTVAPGADLADVGAAVTAVLGRGLAPGV